MSTNVANKLNQFKIAFSNPGRFIHLNNAGVAPISRPSLESLAHWSRRLYEEGTHAIPDVFLELEGTRHLLAQFLNAAPETTVFFQGTANAISQVAFGLTLKPGDEIILWDQEYPSNFYPWRDAARSAGAKLVVVPSPDINLSSPVERLKEKITNRTRVIAFSWVQFQTGAMTDLKEMTTIAKENRILTVADIIQGAGHIPFDFKNSGLDVACGGSHKWLVSPPGVGFICTTPAVFNELRPQAVGAFTYGTPNDLSNVDAIMQTGPQKFEPGSRPILDIMAFGATLRLLLEVGIESISKEVENLAGYLINGLKEHGYTIRSPHGNGQHRGGIVTFAPNSKSALKTLEQMDAALIAQKISFAKRGDGIRLSPHAFNTIDNLNATLKALVP